jgi:hypothetical protein
MALHAAPGGAISRPGGPALGAQTAAPHNNNGRPRQRTPVTVSACGLRGCSAAPAALQPLPCAPMQPQQGSSSSWRRQCASGVGGRACLSSSSSWHGAAANTNTSSSSRLAVRPAAASGTLVPLAPPVEEHVWVPFKVRRRAPCDGCWTSARTPAAVVCSSSVCCRTRRHRCAISHTCPVMVTPCCPVHPLPCTARLLLLPACAGAGQLQ